jgi:hypothetical protein
MITRSSLFTQLSNQDLLAEVRRLAACERQATTHPERRSGGDLRSSVDPPRDGAGTHSPRGDAGRTPPPAIGADIAPRSGGGEAGGLDPGCRPLRVRGDNGPLHRDGPTGVSPRRALRARRAAECRQHRAPVCRSQRPRSGVVFRRAAANAGERNCSAVRGGVTAETALWAPMLCQLSRRLRVATGLGPVRTEFDEEEVRNEPLARSVD